MGIDWEHQWKAKPLEEVDSAVDRIMAELGYPPRPLERSHDPYEVFLEVERTIVERGVRRSVLWNRGVRHGFLLE